MKNIIIIIFILLIGGLAGYLVFSWQNPKFEKLSAEEMHERIIKERDYAISKAVIVGDFRCCINPPCTMCYMEANQWNNQTAGTCACDDLIAQGKEPCPQCQGGLEKIHSEENTYCDINAEVSTCNSNK
jgi:hypothetical protein